MLRDILLKTGGIVCRLSREIGRPLVFGIRMHAAGWCEWELSCHLCLFCVSFSVCGGFCFFGSLGGRAIELGVLMKNLRYVFVCWLGCFLFAYLVFLFGFRAYYTVTFTTAWVGWLTLVGHPCVSLVFSFFVLFLLLALLFCLWNYSLVEFSYQGI